jgi:hypothetical protein
MARARNIKPSFFSNDRLAELPAIARLLFIGLWTIADYRGCCELRTRRIRAQLLPYDAITDEDVGAYLGALEHAGFIASYQVAGQRYFKITGFAKHQNPHKNERDAGSLLPDIDKAEAITNNLEQDGTARADSLFLIPDSPILNPDPLTLIPDPKPLHDGLRPSRLAKQKPEPKTAVTWSAYADAYQGRYGVQPVRNASVNGKLAQVVDRLGSEAPQVAAFYVGLNDAWYVRHIHDVGTLLRDCESLRTQWATGNVMTAAKATQADRTATNLDAFAGLIDAALERERAS